MEKRKIHENGNVVKTDTAKWSSRHLLMLSAGMLLFYLILYILPLGQRPLTYPDEVRYAEIPREMLLSSNWVVPHLDGLRYFEKPPLGYWVNAIAISLFGENEFAVRLPSAIASGLTTLLLFIFTLRTTLNIRLALFAALIHMTILTVYVVSSLNAPDSLLTFFLTGGIILFYFAAEANTQRTGSQALWWLAGGFFGLAFLAKGFLAFAIPFLILVPWILWNGQWHLLLTRSWQVIAAALLVIMPWSILIAQQEGDFWHYFFWVEHVRRFTAENAQHREPFYFYLMYLPVLLFPWLTLLPAAISGLLGKFKNIPTGHNQPQLSSTRLAWLWFLLPFLFFSVSKGKLFTYILPCFPAIAFLMATGLFYYFEKQRKLFNAGVLFNTLVLICLLIGLFINQSIATGSRIYTANENDHVIILTITLITGTIAGLIAFYNKRPDIKLLANAALISPLLFAIDFIIPEHSLELKAPGVFLEHYKDQITDDTLIISDGNIIRAVTWYFKRDDVYLISEGELDYGLKYLDSTDKLLDQEQFSELMIDSANRPFIMVCNPTCDERYSKFLPAAASKENWGDFELWHNNMSTAK
jgi:4-amino-4-deoxy-L-arabinose transferase